MYLFCHGCTMLIKMLFLMQSDTNGYKAKAPSYSLSTRFNIPSDVKMKPGPGAYMPEKVSINLNNYFNLHVCLSLCLCVRHTLQLDLIPPVVSQNLTDKSCLVCVTRELYTFWVILRSLGHMRPGEAELHTLCD